MPLARSIRSFVGSRTDRVASDLAVSLPLAGAMLTVIDVEAPQPGSGGQPRIWLRWDGSEEVGVSQAVYFFVEIVQVWNAPAGINDPYDPRAVNADEVGIRPS